MKNLFKLNEIQQGVLNGAVAAAILYEGSTFLALHNIVSYFFAFAMLLSLTAIISGIFSNDYKFSNAMTSLAVILAIIGFTINLF